MTNPFILLSRLVSTRPWIIIGLVTVITMFLGFGLGKITVDTDSTKDIPADLPEKVFYDQVGEIFPSDDFLIVAVTDSRGVFEPDVLSDVKKLTDTLKATRGVKKVISISSAGIITGTNAGLEIQEAMPVLPGTPEEIQAFRELTMGYEMTAGLIGKDGKSTAIMVTVKEEIDTTPMPRAILRIDPNLASDAAFKKALSNLTGVQRVYWGTNPADLYDAEVTYLAELETDTDGKIGVLLEMVADADLAGLEEQVSLLVRDSQGEIHVTSEPVTIYNRLKAIVSLMDKKTDGEVYISGSKAVSGIVKRLLIMDLSRLFPVVIVVIGVVLLISFRTLRGVLLPLCNVVLSVIWAMGLVGWIGQSLSMATMMIPIILIAVGTAYTIHVINRYYEELTKTADKKTALETTVSNIALPVFLAGTTTFIGFLSLTISRIGALRLFGVMTALGIFFALVLALTLTPAILMVLKAPKARRASQKKKQDRFGQALGKIGQLVLKKPLVTVSVALVVIVICAVNAPRAAFESNTISSFKKGSEVRDAYEYLNENFTGVTSMTIIAKVEEDGAILDTAVLRAVDGLQDYLETLRLVGDKVVDARDPDWNTGVSIVGGSQSIINIIKGINKALNADNPAFNKIPDEITDVPVLTEIYRLNKGQLDELDSETKERLFTYEQGTDFRIEGNNAFLDFNGIERRIDLRSGQAVELIPGRIYSGQLVFQYENSGDPQDIEALMDVPRRSIKISVFLKTASSSLVGQVQAYAREYIANEFPAGSRADITGYSNLILAIMRLLVESQVSSVLASLIIVFIFISLMTRSLIEGFFSIIPLSAAIIINFGLMAIAGIPIDMSTATIASIGIGIGIDYTLHFMDRLKSNLISLDYVDAVIQTMSTTGKGIFYNAIAVAIGFLVLLFSQLQGNMYMGMLMALIMVTSSIFAVTLQPALLYLFKPKFLYRRKNR